MDPVKIHEFLCESKKIYDKKHKSMNFSELFVLFLLSLQLCLVTPHLHYENNYIQHIIS